MTRRAVHALVAVALAGCTLAGCSRELGPDQNGTAGESVATADTARTKLSLQAQDSCYTGDVRASWPRCGRWVEETAGTARTATGALPSDAAVSTAAGTVIAGRDAFTARGCTGMGSGSDPDPGQCVAALGGARTGVRALAVALGVPSP